jgi:hypothetical protein
LLPYVNNLHLEFHFVASPHNLGSFIIHQKKIQPIPNSRCWYQPFSIGKVSSKSKTENLKCQNEVILGDFNFHNSDIYVLNFYVWFEWVAPKNFNPMDNHHKFQKEQCICVGSTMLHMVHKEELWFLRVHWIDLKSGRCLQESKAIHVFKHNFMPRPFLDTYMVGWWPRIS